MNYTETKQKLNELRRKDELLFRMAISHLMDVGVRHLAEETIEATCADIMKQDDSHAFMTNKYQCALVRLAGELAKVDHIYLLNYISKEIFYDVGDDKPSYDRAIEIIRDCLCYMADAYGSYRMDEEETLGKFRNIGLKDKEIEYFGWKELLDWEEDEGTEE